MKENSWLLTTNGSTNMLPLSDSCLTCIIGHH